uniref:Ig-like domain-containing protein n=1 Tax=Pyxicephalus adspersus TaxID=30357 RepID=A0AAV3AI79_PYXAD|nr:TPA: hypothetical protein GDO54_013614 [Pyxicephalus adspersus]
MSDNQLIQSSSELKQTGQSVTMTCKGMGFQLSDYIIVWYQQVSGGGLTWIGYIYVRHDVTNYSSLYEGRFTITSDKSANTAYLQINNVKVEDTATYYCARDTVIQGWNLSYKNLH